MATRFGIDHVDFEPIDLTEANHPGYARIAGAIVLTYYCLEQEPGVTLRESWPPSRRG